VQVTGSGFGRSEKVSIGLPGKVLATGTATRAGNLRTTPVALPPNAPFGQTSLTATGQASGKTATAAITIANNWEQLGYGPGHAGHAPNDPTLLNLVHPGGNIFLNPAWMYQSGAAITTAPAIADSVAYTANTAGQLTAIDVRNGAPLWTSTLPSAPAINGSPAVDPSHGLVFAGAHDGSLDALSAASGKLAWAATIGGDVSAPVYGAGQVYVTSSNGTVAAFAEQTGTRSWSVKLPRAISAAPSLETSSKTLVVAESSGTVVGLAAGSGSQRWSFRSGGPVSAPPAVVDGTVYFGSADGSVYAVSTSTGAKLWSFATHGPVADTPALTNDGTPRHVLELLTGSGDGNLYAINAATGSLIYQVPFQHPIVGVAAVRGVVILDTSSGLVGAARSYSDLDLWKFQTGAAIASPPAIADGTVYVGAEDGRLYAFTSYGQLPDTALAPFPGR
jgi:eukaryotic-like serine/threonine-protein kinase